MESAGKIPKRSRGLRLNMLFERTKLNWSGTFIGIIQCVKLHELKKIVIVTQ